MSNLRNLLFSDKKQNDSIANRQLREQSSIITDRYKSPFYEGVVSYGGISAKRVRLSQVSPYSLASKPAVITRIKNDDVLRLDNNEQLSNSAKNVLKILEKISSPLEDAKKIPIYSPKSSEKYLINISKPFKKLSSLRTPRLISSVKTSSPIDKESLQLKYEGIHNLNTSYSASNSTINQFNYQNDNNDSSIVGGKMKTKLFKNRKSNINTKNELVNENNLPNISLPITSLPIFNFNKNENSTVNDKKDNTDLTHKRSSIFIYKENKDEDNLIYKEFNFSAPKIIKLGKVNEDLFKNIIKKESSLVVNPIDEKIDSFEQIKTSFPKESPSNLEKDNEVNKVNKLDTDFNPKENKATLANTCVLNNHINENIKNKSPSPTTKKWLCDSCLYSNDISLEKCKSCGFPKNKEDAEKNINNLYSNYIFGAINTEKKVFNTFKASDTKPQESDFSKNLFNNSLSNLKPQNETPNIQLPTTKTISSNIKLNENKIEENKVDNNLEKKIDDKNNSIFKIEKKDNTAKETKPLTNSTFNFVSIEQLDKIDTKQNSTLNNWKNQFAPEKNSWECSVCLVKNKSSSLKCVCCENPNSNKPKTESPTISLSSSGFQFVSPTNTKTNEKELKLTSDNESNNKDLTVKTTNPETTSLSPKIFGTVSSFQPSTSVSPKFCFGLASSTNSTSSSTTTITTTTSSGLNWPVKISMNNWSCKSCLFSNSKDAIKCVGCGKSNSDEKTQVVTSANLFKTNFTLTDTKLQPSTNLFRRVTTNLGKPEPTFKLNDQLSTNLTSSINSSNKPNEGFNLDFTPSTRSLSDNKFNDTSSIFSFGTKSTPVETDKDKAAIINLNTSTTLTNSTSTVPTFNFGQSEPITNTSTPSNNFVFGSQTSNTNLNNGLNFNSTSSFPFSLTNSTNLFNSNMTNGFNSSAGLFGSQPLVPTTNTNVFNIQQPNLNFSQVPSFNFSSTESAPAQNNIFQFAAKMDGPISGPISGPPPGRNIRRARRRLGPS